MTNPLIEKYNELYNPKPPEPPKPVEKPKLSTIKSYDKYSGNDAFLELAEKVKNGTAQVSSVSLRVDAHGVFGYGKRITFEVYDYEP